MTEPSQRADADPTLAQAAAAFVARWQAADGSELANYQLFVSDLCQLLEVPAPDPARDDTRDNAYVFERRVSFRHGDGSSSSGRIDCYKRGHFVLEAKKIRLTVASKGFDDALQRARGQAEGYARALPADEGRPPFLISRAPVPPTRPSPTRARIASGSPTSPTAASASASQRYGATRWRSTRRASRQKSRAR